MQIGRQADDHGGGMDGKVRVTRQHVPARGVQLVVTDRATGLDLRVLSHAGKFHARTGG